MKVIYDLGTTSFKKTAVAIGVFDGVHQGHQLLINNAVKQAKRLKAKSLVITFFPHPAHVLSSKNPLPYLISLGHRLELFKRSKVDIVWVVRFNKKFAQINPRSFIENILVKKLGVKSINVGGNFRFGKDRVGDIDLFRKLSKQFGYKIHAYKPILSGKKIISSGRLRQLIPQGDLAKASLMLGRPVSVMGKVVKGASRGKALGFPTANIQYECGVLLPLGVYAVGVRLKDKYLFGMANLGYRPSFKEPNPKVLLEVHLFDFHQNIYDQKLEVEFLKRIRDEKKFASSADLIRQIKKDEIISRHFFAHLKNHS